MSTTEVEYRVRVHQPTGEIRVEWRPTQQAREAKRRTKAWEDTKACQEQKSRDAAQEALERAAAGKERVRADAK